MYADNKEYCELLALTQRYLLQEYRPEQLIPIEAEAYFLFKREAQAAPKKSKNSENRASPGGAQQPQQKPRVMEKQSSYTPSPPPASSRIKENEDHPPEPPKKSGKLPPLHLKETSAPPYKVEQKAPNDGDRSSGLLREPPAAAAPPSDFEEIRKAIQKQLPNFPWRDLPPPIPAPYISETATLLLICCEYDEAARTFFRAVEVAISTRLHPCTLVELAGVAPQAVYELWNTIALLPALRSIILSGTVANAVIPAGVTLLPIEGAAAYLLDPQKKRELWAMLLTFLHRGAV